jgi:hypothetical protein
MLIVDSNCTNGCNCAGRPFSPVCDQTTGISYYSPCHAGCSDVFSKNDVNFKCKTKLCLIFKLDSHFEKRNRVNLNDLQGKFYGNCTCLASKGWIFSDGLEVSPNQTTLALFPETAQTISSADDEPNTVVKRGFCEGGCSGFWTYVIISTCFKFVGALPFSGNQMLSFRLIYSLCIQSQETKLKLNSFLHRIVDPDLKALSKAVRTLLASLFGKQISIRYDSTRQYDTIRYDNTIRCETIRYVTMRGETIRYETGRQLWSK